MGRSGAQPLWTRNQKSWPFTPPTAARDKRQNNILASEVEPHPPHPLDFDDVVDDDLDPEPEEAIVDAAHPSAEELASSALNGTGFCCPFEDCKPASVRWLSVDELTKHLLQVHVRGGQHPLPAFLSAIGRWECTKCQALHSLRSPCPRERALCRTLSSA